MLGLYDDAGVLHHVGVTSSFTMAMRRQLADELGPLRKNALEDHPWRDWANANDDDAGRMPGGAEPLERRQGPVVGAAAARARVRGEVRPPARHRFRHAAVFLRWRPDKPPQDCRYDQLEVTTAFELAKVSGRAEPAWVIAGAARLVTPARAGCMRACRSGWPIDGMRGEPGR